MAKGKADEIKKLISQIPGDKLIEVVEKAAACKDFADGVKLAKSYGIEVTEAQLRDYADWAMNEMSDKELEDIVSSCVPFFLVKPAVALVKSALKK